MGEPVDDGPQVLRIHSVARIAHALDAAAIPRDRPVLVLVGGAGGMDEAEITALDTALQQAVVPVLNRHAATVIDGGTDVGVMRAIGRARRATGSRFCLIGVAAEGTIILPGHEPPAVDAAPLDADHTHAVLVPGATWGDESPWIAQVATACAGGRPSVTVLAHGGDIAYHDVANSLAHDRPVVVMAGSGRTADAIAAAGTSTDPRATDIARAPLTRIVPIGDPTAIRSAVEDAFAPRRQQG